MAHKFLGILFMLVPVTLPTSKAIDPCPNVNCTQNTDCGIGKCINPMDAFCTYGGACRKMCSPENVVCTLMGPAQPDVCCFGLHCSPSGGNKCTKNTTTTTTSIPESTTIRIIQFRNSHNVHVAS